MEERSHTDLESSIEELEERAEKWDTGTGNFVLYVPGGCGAIFFVAGLTGDFDLRNQGERA